MSRLLAPIQRRAAQIITGAFRTTATNAVEVEAHLLPLDQQMEKLSLQTILRILSGSTCDAIGLNQDESENAPLAHHIKISRKHHKLHPVNLEHQHPHIAPLWWTPLKVVINNTPELTMSNHKEISAIADILYIYTDGSGINGHIRAAAVTLISVDYISYSVPLKRAQYMGNDSNCTVYAAELAGIVLVLRILLDPAIPKSNRAVIFTDNQSALKTIRNPAHTSGQYILGELLGLLENAINQGIDIELRWIPAHRGIPGNEAADTAAKEAAKDFDQAHALGLAATTLLTKAKRTIHEATYHDWDLIWSHGPHGRVLQALGAKPDGKTLKLHKGLPRALSSVITQMRTGKIGLNAYLHGIDKAESAQCSCNQGQQTVEHVLLRCRQWLEERQEMWAGGRPILNLRTLLNDHKMAVRAARMMLKTGLLGQCQAVPITALVEVEPEAVRNSIHGEPRNQP